MERGSETGYRVYNISESVTAIDGLTEHHYRTKDVLKSIKQSQEINPYTHKMVLGDVRELAIREPGHTGAKRFIDESERLAAEESEPNELAA